MGWQGAGGESCRRRDGTAEAGEPASAEADRAREAHKARGGRASGCALEEEEAKAERYHVCLITGPASCNEFYAIQLCAPVAQPAHRRESHASCAVRMQVLQVPLLPPLLLLLLLQVLLLLLLLLDEDVDEDDEGEPLGGELAAGS